MSDPRKRNNIRTALILASVALAFFVGIFIKRIWLS
ncbi:MAG TPA: cytochrome oxidase small assembly protein [Noviherbaspirillum sp.]|nr:cytochrome oxidase small assembly protein [Noviherbaspirillum sp.]HJV87945.1 cytochrome oxidase small assembly protein [Noviherbaspirillum sp.]